MKKAVFVSVPASSGNIGPGFDVLGLSLNFRNEVRVRVVDSDENALSLRIVGEGASSLSRNSSNIVIRSMAALFKKAGKPMPAIDVVCINRIPLARGLGSSSAAYLSGLLAANGLLENAFSREEILNFATDLEGHPDNVAPALFGGVRASGVLKGKVVSVAWPIPNLTMVVAIPAFELSTKKARAVLPAKVPMKDAVSNLAAVSLLPFAFSGKEEWLSSLLNDRLHEPYRAKLVPGFSKVKEAALKAGALGVTLSGAGPTMLAFAEKATAKRVASAMEKTFRKSGVECETKLLTIDRKGAVVK